ncbi:MAG: hypothetical protein ABSE68_03325 [Minisyncoccia bacterium]
MDISVLISFLALFISLIALWKADLAPFKPITTTSDISFRVYRMTEGKEEWYIPSAHIALSVCNSGAKPGKVLDTRLIVQYAYNSSRVKKHKEEKYILEPRWEIDPTKFLFIAHQRFEWISKAILQDWAPFVVLQKSVETKHLIFETTWDKRIINKKVLFKLEMLTDADKEWIFVEKWEFNLTRDRWNNFMNDCCYILQQGKNSEVQYMIHSPAYHEHIKSGSHK